MEVDVDKSLFGVSQTLWPLFCANCCWYVCSPGRGQMWGTGGIEIIAKVFWSASYPDKSRLIYQHRKASTWQKGAGGPIGAAIILRPTAINQSQEIKFNQQKCRFYFDFRCFLEELLWGQNHIFCRFLNHQKHHRNWVFAWKCLRNMTPKLQ